MNIALVLIHNKTDNFNQIEALKPFIEKKTVVNDEYDDTGNVIGTFETYYYALIGLTLPHELRVFQIIPFGVTPPTNLYDIDSHKVFYGIGDENKTGNHPRFFNWALKRGTDYGADIVVYLIDSTQLTAAKIQTGIELLKNGTEFIDRTWVKIVTKTALVKIGQMIENKTFNQALTNYKNRVVQGGYKNG